MFSTKYLETKGFNHYLMGSEKAEKFHFSEFFFSDPDDGGLLNPGILKHCSP